MQNLVAYQKSEITTLQANEDNRQSLIRKTESLELQLKVKITFMLNPILPVCGRIHNAQSSQNVQICTQNSFELWTYFPHTMFVFCLIIVIMYDLRLHKRLVFVRPFEKIITCFVTRPRLFWLTCFFFFQMFDWPITIGATDCKVSLCLCRLHWRQSQCWNVRNWELSKNVMSWRCATVNWRINSTDLSMYSRTHTHTHHFGGFSKWNCVTWMPVFPPVYDTIASSFLGHSFCLILSTPQCRIAWHHTCI